MIITWGDVDGDNVITAADSRIVLRYSTDLEELTPEQCVLADVDGDAVVTAADSRYILQYASNLIDKFPLYE